MHADIHFNIPLLSFLSIGIGGLSCVLGSALAAKFGAQRVAFYSLVLSGTCCVLAPLLLFHSNALFFIVFLFFWENNFKNYEIGFNDSHLFGC